MKRFRTIYICFLYLFFGSLVFSQTGILVPRDVFVGDSAEFSFDTGVFGSAYENGTILTLAPEDFPVSPDVTILSIEVTIHESLASVKIRFIPWISGVVNIPDFSVKKIIMHVPPAHISSLIEKTGRNVLESARPPLLVPGTSYLLYGGIAVFLILSLILIAGTLKLRSYLARTVDSKQSYRRVKYALKQLRLLEKQINASEPEKWYRNYSAFLHSYFGSFCSGHADSFLSATASEMIVNVSRRLSATANPERNPINILDDLRTHLSHIDLIRFSGYSNEDTRVRDIQFARSFIDTIEKYIQEVSDDKF